MIRSVKATSNYMPPEQLQQVLEAIPTLHIRKWPDQDIQMLIQIVYWCSLRWGEGIRLKAEDFDLERKKISLGDTKANDNDYADIPVFFIPKLQFFLQSRTGSLFPELTYDTSRRWIERLGKELHIKAWETPQSETHEKTKTHIFRKSLAKDQLFGTFGKKAPLTTISKTLRHRGKNPLASTIHYIKADSEDVGNYWDEVGSIF